MSPDPTTFNVHPACAAFPLIEGDPLAALVADIKKNGLLEPVIIDGDELLDGRNRLRACALSGVPPRYQQWNNRHPSKTAWIVSVNLTRRHLDASQRAMLALDLEPIFAIEAKDEQRRAAEETNRKKAEPQRTLGELMPQARKPRATDLAGASTGVSGRYVRDAKKVKEEAPDLLEDVRSGALTLTKAKGIIKQREKAEVAEQLRAEPLPPINGPYRVIAIDPPWTYTKRAEDTTHRGRLPYPEMGDEAILSLPVSELAHDDCVLWLWTTNAHIHLAFHCLERWGFTHKTILTWVKDRMGVGDWLRGQTEHCLMAVKGRPTTTLTNQTTALHGPMREHSRKPDEFFALVDKLCPGSKLEMFAREARPGWHAWGAETDKFS